MATKLKLKLRERGDILQAPAALIVEWMNQSEKEAKDSLYEYFSPLVEGEVMVHDKVFLETTMNWSPVTQDPSGRMIAQGLPMTEQVRWIGIGQKLEAIDPEEEGEISLTNKDIELIWERWKNPEFKLGALQPHNIAFIMYFQETTNRWFEELEPEEEESENKHLDEEEIEEVENGNPPTNE